jgi:CorA-like Mg2+ transporter protein
MQSGWLDPATAAEENPLAMAVATHQPTAAARLTAWAPQGGPRELGPGESPAPSELLWCDLGDGATVEEALAELGPLCPELDRAMLVELLTPDALPEDNEWLGGQVKLASTCALAFERLDEGPDDDIDDGVVIVQPVELLASERWLISRWHPARRIADGPGEDARGEPLLSRGDCEAAVERRWRNGDGRTAGDLGVLVMHQLALTYAPAERELSSVLEDWELRLYEGDRTPEQLSAQREALRRLWRLRAVLRDWIAPLNRPGMSLDVEKVWLPATDHAEAIRVDDRMDRVLDNLTKLGENLRASFHLIHLEESERERDRRELVQRRVEIVAAVFLVPTFIFGLYGSNTWLPGQGSVLGFIVMVLIVVGVTIGSVLLIQRWQRDRAPGSTVDGA